MSSASPRKDSAEGNDLTRYPEFSRNPDSAQDTAAFSSTRNIVLLTRLASTIASIKPARIVHATEKRRPEGRREEFYAYQKKPLAKILLATDTVNISKYSFWYLLGDILTHY